MSRKEYIKVETDRIFNEVQSKFNVYEFLMCVHLGIKSREFKVTANDYIKDSDKKKIAINVVKRITNEYKTYSLFSSCKYVNNYYLVIISLYKKLLKK